MRHAGKVISFITPSGSQWAFIIIPEDQESLFDSHIEDHQLQIVQKGDELRVQFTDAAAKTKINLGQIIKVQDTKFTEEAIAALCKEHGLIEGVEGLQEKSAPLPSTTGTDHAGPTPE